MSQPKRIVVVGDLHLDCKINGRDYHADVCARMDEVRKHVEEDDLVVVLGDVADPTGTPEMFRALTSFSRWASEMPTTESVVVVCGNHDVIDHAYARSSLEVLAGDPHLAVVDRVEILEPQAKDGIRLLFLPWLSRAHGSVDVEGLAGEAIGEDPRRVIVFCHLDVTGAVFGSEDEMPRNGRLELPVSVVNDPRVIRVVGGHLHKPQMIGEKVQIVGSLERLGFRDSDQDEKGFLIIEVGKEPE